MGGVINYLLITNCSKFDIVLCLTASVIGAKIVRLLEFRHEVMVIAIESFQRKLKNYRVDTEMCWVLLEFCNLTIRFKF